MRFGVYASDVLGCYDLVGRRLRSDVTEFRALLTSALQCGWRLSAVVASFVARTKLLNVELG